GNIVAFDTRQFGGIESVFRYDNDSGISVRVSPEGQFANSPVMSEGGNKIAFLGAPSALGPFQVLSRDMLFTNVAVVSVATNGNGGVVNLENSSILISYDV